MEYFYISTIFTVYLVPNLSGKPVLFNQHHIGGGRPMMINGAPFQHYNYPPGVPTSAFMSMRRPPPASDIDGGGMLLGGGGPDGRTVKVLRIRFVEKVFYREKKVI